MNISMIELWLSMGWFARAVVIVLVLMSTYAATVAIKKGLQFRRSRLATIAFSPLFSRAVREGDYAAAADLVAEYGQSHLAASFRGVFSNLKAHGQEKRPPALTESLQRTVELNALERIAHLRRGLGVLATAGATAPFVGLLGTVVGVMNAFTGMAAAGSGGLAAISQGIAEALVATAAGLLVAIPAVWLYNYFINRIEFVTLEIKYTTTELIGYLQAAGTRAGSEADRRPAAAPAAAWPLQSATRS